MYRKIISVLLLLAIIGLFGTSVAVIPHAFAEGPVAGTGNDNPAPPTGNTGGDKDKQITVEEGQQMLQSIVKKILYFAGFILLIVAGIIAAEGPVNGQTRLGPAILVGLAGLLLIIFTPTLTNVVFVSQDISNITDLFNKTKMWVVVAAVLAAFIGTLIMQWNQLGNSPMSVFGQALFNGALAGLAFYLLYLIIKFAISFFTLAPVFHYV